MARVGCTLVTAAMVLGGCGAPTDAPRGPSVSDSAGVRMVAYADVDAPRLHLGEAPRVRVGLGEEGDLTLFGVVGGAVLPGGDFIVADAGNYRVVRWSVGGDVVGTFGSQGAGPGEFQNILWMQAGGDGVALYDARLSRISWFDPMTGFVHSTQFAVPRPDPPSDDALMASGAALGVFGTSEVLGYPMAHADPVGVAGPLPLYGDFAVYDAENVELRPLGRFLLMEWYEDPDNGRFPLANRLEAPRAHWSGRQDVVAVSHATDYRIDVLEAGRRRTVVTETAPRIPFTPDSIPAPYQLAVDSLQAYRDVRVDGQRRIWVRPAVAAGADSTVWRVFTVDGDRVGELLLPSDALVLDATDAVILLLRRGELDEESVEAWDFLPLGG